MGAPGQAVETRVIERPFGPFERMLATRYLGTKREHGGLAFISIVSVVGITLGVMALIITMSVMNGFRIELISKIIGFEPHVFVTTRGLPQPEVDALMDDIRIMPGVESVGPLTQGQGLASAYGVSTGTEIRGVLPEDLRKNPLISKSLAEGAKLRAGPPQPFSEYPRYPVGDGSLDHFGEIEPGSDLSDDVVIGDALASRLTVGVGDTIKILQPNGASSVLGTAPRTRNFRVVAIYHVGNERYDNLMAFLPIESAKNFFGEDEGYPIVGVRIANPDAANEFADKLGRDKALSTTTWLRQNGTYMTALIVERNVMRLILFIVVIITALNIITGVLMVVKNKARDVAILRTIGSTRSGVVRVFLMTGTFLGMAGVGTGVLLGVVVALNIAPIQHTLEFITHTQLFPRDIYMLDALPAKLEWAEVAWVAGSAFVVTLVMSIIPSMWAARLNPVEALRFE
jgi:lipoprotein-releasing system permease protein